MRKVFLGLPPVEGTEPLSCTIPSLISRRTMTDTVWAVSPVCLAISTRLVPSDDWITLITTLML